MNKKNLTETITESHTIQQVCPNCGSSEITFDKNKGKLYCHYCKTEFEGKKIKNITTNLSNLQGQVIGTGAQNIKENTKDIITLQCGSCGAEIVIDKNNSTSARCHWCRSILSINSKISNGIMPDAILPFSIKKEEAERIMKKFIKNKSFFAYHKFKKELTTDNIIGVYFPYMLIDAKAHCIYSGEGDHITDVLANKNGPTYCDATRHKIKREFDITINNLTIESNKERLDKNNKNKTNNIINSIMPFDTENAIEFQSNYLIDFTSEKRNINVNELEEIVNKRIKDIAKHSINNDLEYYNRGIKWETEDIKVQGTQWISTYLPVWLYSYREEKINKNTIHYIAVNGRTKEVMGSIPINKPLIFITTLIITVLIGTIVIPLFLGFPEIRLPIIIIFFIILTSSFRRYRSIKKVYRNKDARHTYEKETTNIITNLQKEDHYLTTIKAQKDLTKREANNRSLEGENIKITKKEKR